jgi:hypothetical protein
VLGALLVLLLSEAIDSDARRREHWAGSLDLRDFSEQTETDFLRMVNQLFFVN